MNALRHKSDHLHRVATGMSNYSTLSTYRTTAVLAVRTLQYKAQRRTNANGSAQLMLRTDTQVGRGAGREGPASVTVALPPRLGEIRESPRVRLAV